MKKSDDRAALIEEAWTRCLSLTGRAPTMQELANAANLKSKASAHLYTHRLISEGRIQPLSDHQAVYRLHTENAQLRAEIERLRDHG